MQGGQTVRQACGLTRPQPALRVWPPDAHLLWALLLAVPVWWGLLLSGAALRVPANWVAAVSLVLLQPLLEELTFRGVLQGFLLDVTAPQSSPHPWRRVTWANLWVTLLFVALHLRAQPLAWALAVALPSLVLGHLRERFGSVWPCVGVHVFYNAGFGVTAWLAAGAYLPQVSGAALAMASHSVCVMTWGT
jgi:membrane protease YdiL (CAAX protease family)